MAGAIQGISRELADILERLAAKYNKPIKEAINDPKLRAEAKRELASKVRFDKSQPATMQDVEDQARSRALPGTVGVQPGASLRSKLLGAGENTPGSAVASPFEKPLEVDALPAVDLDANMLGRRVKQGAALTAGAGALGLGLSGSGERVGEGTVLAPESTPEPEAEAEPSAPADSVETEIGGSDTIDKSTDKVQPDYKVDSTAYDNATKTLRDYTKNYKAAGLDVSDIEAKINEAEKLYKSERNRNEALALAQTIGQSLARLGASIYGAKQGRPMAPLEFRDSIDYGKRSDSAREDFRDSVRSAEARRRETTEAATRADREKYDRGYAALKANQDAEEVKFREANKRAGETFRQRMDAAEQAKREGRFEQKQAEQELKQINREEEALRKEEKNIDKVVAALQDGDNKQLERMAERFGYSVKEIKAVADAANDDFFQNDEEKKARVDAVRNSLMESLQPKFDELRARRAEAEAKKGGTGSPQQQQRSKGTPQSSKQPSVRMRDAQGKLWDIPADKAAQAERDGLIRVGK